MNLVFAADGAGVAGFGGVAAVVLGGVEAGGAAGVCERAAGAAVRSAEQSNVQVVRLVMRAMIRQARMNRADFFRNLLGD
jgi:hypothetical protein